MWAEDNDCGCSADHKNAFADLHPTCEGVLDATREDLERTCSVLAAARWCLTGRR